MIRLGWIVVGVLLSLVILFALFVPKSSRLVDRRCLDDCDVTLTEMQGFTMVTVEELPDVLPWAIRSNGRGWR